MQALRWLLLLSTAALLSAQGAAAKPREVLLIGDSITEGSVSGGSGPPYAEVLAELLGPEHDVTNAGCGGSTSLDWTISQAGRRCGALGILEDGLFVLRAAPHLPTNVAVVLLGTNDAIGFFEPVPVEVPIYAAAMNEIVWNLLTSRARYVILMTAPDHAWEDPEPLARLAGYRDEILALCESHPRIFCGPDLHQLLDPDVHFAPGALHPNAEGHATIAAELAEVVTEVTAPSSCGVGPELAALLPALRLVRRRRFGRR